MTSIALTLPSQRQPTSLGLSVLVLNRSFVAVHITNVRRAITLLFRQLAEVVHIEDLSGLASKLRNAPNLAMETRVRPLWHTGSVFGFALICLCGEWFLRRRNGAA